MEYNGINIWIENQISSLNAALAKSHTYCNLWFYHMQYKRTGWALNPHDYAVITSTTHSTNIYRKTRFSTHWCLQVWIRHLTFCWGIHNFAYWLSATKDNRTDEDLGYSGQVSLRNKHLRWDLVRGASHVKFLGEEHSRQRNKCKDNSPLCLYQSMMLTLFKIWFQTTFHSMKSSVINPTFKLWLQCTVIYSHSFKFMVLKMLIINCSVFILVSQ